MANSYFQFKQFRILQEKSAMKVGTDGVLLGALATTTEVKTILDIGTGTGLIALMLAQRSISIIDAVEIDKDAYNEAIQNVTQSPWSDRIRLHYTSIQEFSIKMTHFYDLIVSNPPFFSNAIASKNLQKNLARHTNSLNANDLLVAAAKLLNPRGVLQVIIPVETAPIYIETGKKYLLYCYSKIWIKPTTDKAPKRVVLTFGKAKNLEIKEKVLIVESGGRHVYSPEYQELTKDFYLYF